MKKQTLIIEISDTENASWQGTVEWVQTQQKQYFRSAVELLRLMDSAVCTGKTDWLKKEDSTGRK